MALDQVFTALYRIADLYFLGRLGPVVLAASSLCNMATFTVLTVGFGVAVAGLATVARRIGENDPEGAAHALWQVLLLGATIGLVLGSVGAAFARPILDLLGAEGRVLDEGSAYLRVSFHLLALPVVSLALNRALRGAGEPRTALWTMAVGALVSLGLCPLLISGAGSFEGLGIVGSAYAGAAGQAVSITAAMIMLMSGRLRLRMTIRSARPDIPVLVGIIRVGAPVTGQLVLRSTARLALAPLIATFGPAALAAYGIMVRVMLFPLSIGFGLGNAAGTLVGQNLGAGKPRRAARAAWIIAAVNVTLMALAATCFIVWARELVGVLVVDGSEVVEEGVRVLYLLAPTYVFAALGVVMGRALDGAGDTMPAMWVNLITLWLVQVPLAIGLSLWMDLGTTGIWVGIGAANVLNGIIFAVWFARGSWKSKKV